MWTVTLKWATKKFLLPKILGFIWNKICSLACFKAKTKVILQNRFGDGDCSLINCIRKDSAHLKKIFIFKVPAIFWNWPTKNIPDQQKRAAFRKSQKSAKSLHPIVQYIYCTWSTLFLTFVICDIPSFLYCTLRLVFTIFARKGVVFPSLCELQCPWTREIIP